MKKREPNTQTVLEDNLPADSVEYKERELERTPWYKRIRVSGLYTCSSRVGSISSGAGATRSAADSAVGEDFSDRSAAGSESALDFFPFALREVLCLDVDGRYPLMKASGRLNQGFKSQVHWIANLKTVKEDVWEGKIWYKNPTTASFPYTGVRIEVERSFFTNQTKAHATFYIGKSVRERIYNFTSSYFHPMNFEYDFAEGVQPVVSINTHIHPTHPASLPAETISFEEVYRRAGFDVSTSPGGPVPLSLAGQNQKWNDTELHDAMQQYWSHFANAPQWAIWVFFGAAHEQSPGLAGVMFDDIGPNHRQGTSIFLDSILFDAPAGLVQPQDWEQRYKFWCAVHEAGHCFNLAHSWQKDYPYQGSSWIPLTNNVASTSFMNYPFYYPNGPASSANSETDYFSDFEYRFIDEELLFMRHAPIAFVQPGNADWFDHHGFQGANLVSSAPLRLEVRANRKTACYEFMEPVVLELKLTNISTQPIVLDENILSRLDSMTVIVKKDGKPAQQFVPFAHYDIAPRGRILEPGKSDYQSLFPSVGINGWALSEPGYYTVQVCLRFSSMDIVSAPYRIRIAPPKEHEEEWLAQDFFSEDVGRILTFDGSTVLVSGMDTLREVTRRLADRKVAYHARIALAKTAAKPCKRLELGKADHSFSNATKAGGKIVASKPDPKTAQKEFTQALTAAPEAAAESLGHVDYKWYADQFADWLAETGNAAEASTILSTILKTLQARGVIQPVLDDIAARRAGYRKEKQ